MALRIGTGLAVATLLLAGCQGATSATSVAARGPSPSAPTSTSTGTTPGSSSPNKGAAAAPLRDCSDFSTPTAATAYLQATPAARSSLDTNGDGTACDGKFA